MLAKKFHAVLTLVFVKSPNDQTKETVAEKFLKKSASLCEENHVICKKKIIEGEAPVAILNYAFVDNPDLIVIGARGRSKRSNLFLGNVSNYLSHRSKIPVLLVK